MYPHLLATRPFPVQLAGVCSDITPDDIPHILKIEGLIASVTLKSDRPNYPARHGDRVIYPVGEYSTTLAGPELAAAAEAGEIVRVHGACRYRMGSPFAGWGRYVLALRAEAKRTGDLAGELWAKTLANALGGKFAQRSCRWVPEPDIEPPCEWGPFLSYSRDEHYDPTPPAGGHPDRAAGDIQPGRRLTEYRALAGVTFRREAGRVGTRLPASVFAYLTSYGRTWNNGIRAALGDRSVISTDTDGFYTTDAGLTLARQAGLLEATGPGTLRLVSSHAYYRAFDCKHYYCDGDWTLAGICDGYRLVDSTTADEIRTVNPITHAPRKAPGLIVESIRRVRLDGIPVPDRLTPDGWGLPPVAGPDWQPDPAPWSVPRQPTLFEPPPVPYVPTKGRRLR